MRNILSAAFLVAGTCIGAGMLALADVTGIAGFLPSTLIMLLVFFAMTSSGLLLAEASLWMPEGAHYLSIAETFTGKVGKTICWILFLFISYASLIAYTAEGGAVLSDFSQGAFGWTFGKQWGAVLFLFLFGFLVDFGTSFVGRVNSVLFIAMMISFGIILVGGIPSIQTERLSHTHWPVVWYLFPFLLCSFSFQTIVPSLTPFLQRNGKALATAIVIGTLVTLLVYLSWLWVVLGTIPAEGESGLAAAFIEGGRSTKYFFHHVPSWVAIVAEFFAFFAMVTSFLGMGLGLFDFLSDAMKVEKKGSGKLLLAVLITLPTIIVATQFERVFLVAIDISGGYGDTILSGMLPVLFVWQGRYRMGYQSGFRIPGGKPFLVAVFVFFALCLSLELLIHTGWICSLVEYCQQNFPRTPLES